MPHGGRRRGTPGKAYANRSDLRGGNPLPVTVPTGQPYGAAKALEDQQRALPVSAPSGPPRVATASTATAGAGPGSFGDPLRATERPNEPLSAGLPWGPGPGPEALNPGLGDPTADELRAIYARFPTEALREAIEELED